MILIHGWPGSVVEMLSVVGPLTDPTAHGGSAEDAFDVVIPSIPGYGLSGKPKTSGWGPERVASAAVELMKRLGYTRFVAQGGDWGAVIVDLMGVQAPPELLGIHSNMPGVLPPEIAQRFAPLVAAPAPAGLSAEEQRCYEQVSYMYTKGIGYAVQMLLHPQTLYGIADSPAGLAAWILDHDAQSYLDITSAFVDGNPVGNLTRDEVLDNITLTWFTNTGISSARLYHENAFGFFDAKGVSVPAAVTVFPKELTRRREAGPSAPIRTSSISTRSIGAGTSPPGRSRSCSPTRSGPRSGRCVERRVRADADAPFGGAIEWLNSEPLGPAELRGHVVLVNFWTLTCINWLRQEPYVRAWSRAYRDDGLVVIGVHTPEFSFEHEIELIRAATGARDRLPRRGRQRLHDLDAFVNNYWPALYFIDTDGIIRDAAVR